MRDFSKITAVMIDIDATVLRLKHPAEGQNPADHDSGALFGTLALAAEKFTDLPREEIDRRIEKIKTTVKWWVWPDFILELGLNAKKFWEFAYETESQEVGPSGPELADAITRMHDAGILLYVASNNCICGILHKLRLAGMGHITGAPLFSQFNGASELAAMKWDDYYWKKYLAQIGLDGDEVAVIGDDLEADYQFPHNAGVSMSFIIDRQQDRSAESTDTLIFVQNFDQIADYLLAGR